MYRRSRRGTLYVQRCTIKPPSSWQDARRKTPNDLFLASLSFSSVSPLLVLRPSPSPVCPVSLKLPSKALPSVYSTSLSVLFRPSHLYSRTARCSETLQLLAGGLASYAVLASYVLRGNRRQFAPICVWHHFLEIFVVALNRSRVLARPPVPQLAEDSRRGFFRSRRRILVISFGMSPTHPALS